MTLDNLNTQKIELHTNSENISEINYRTATFRAKFTLDNLNSPYLEHFLFDPSKHFAPHQILIYRELNVVGAISSLAIHKILFSFYWLAIVLILILKSTTSRDVKHKIGNQWDFSTDKQKATILLSP